MRTTSQKYQIFEVKPKRFNKLFLVRTFRLAVNSITTCDGGSLLYPEEPCTIDGTKTVGAVLEAKHPNFCVPDLLEPKCVCFKLYSAVPKAILIEAFSDMVIKMASHRSGGVGPSGIDAVALCYCVLQFDCVLGELHEEMAYCLDWFLNMLLPWVAYHPLMAWHLVALDKQPGVHPVRNGEIWQCLYAKLVVEQAREQTRLPRSSLQLCVGLEARIKGNLYAAWK